MKRLSLVAGNFFILRNPMFPVDDFRKIAEGDVHGQQERLKMFCKTELFREGLFLASPSLDEQVDRWLEKKINDPKDVEKIELTVSKYLTRATYRCTPFGVFASVSLGLLSNDSSRLLLDDLGDGICRHARIDMGFSEVFRIGAIKRIDTNEVKYYPNNTVYRIADEIRYVDYEILERDISYRLSSVVSSPYIEATLRRAERGATKRELYELFDVQSQDEAHSFISHLVDMNLLVSDVQATVTGGEHDRVLLERLREYDKGGSVADCLSSVVSSLRRIDSFNHLSKREVYKKLANQLKSITGDQGTKIQPFQVDVFRTSDLAINRKELSDVLEVVSDIMPFLLSKKENVALQDFKTAFYSRFEEEEVPLMEALDPEYGVGYPVGPSTELLPIFKGINFGPVVEETTTVDLDRKSYFVFQLYLKCLKEDSFSIDLDRDLLKKSFGHMTAGVPHSLSLVGNVLSLSPLRICLNFLTGPSSLNWLGRFCFTNKKIEQFVRQEIVYDTANDELYAEIVHIPSHRVGNILNRPALREYEIPILTRPSIDSKKVINLEDIVISVPGGRQIVLRSRQIGKKIVPRLTTAHAFNGSQLPVYRFLCDLQNQDVTRVIGFEWPLFLQENTFLPRVTCETIVLSRAKWRFQRDKVGTTSFQAFLASFKEFKVQHRLPRLVTIGTGDNKLLVDLSSQICLKLLFKEVEKQEVITLEEVVGEEFESPVMDKSGCRYTNEIVIPLRLSRDESLGSASPPGQFKSMSTIKRTFAIGSEWLFFKIYSGVKTLDSFIANELRSICEKMLGKSIVNSWFFVRYHDEQGMHLRVRFFGKSEFYSQVLSALSPMLNDCINTKRIRSVCCDTYRREIERYGAENIADTEMLFFFDSLTVSNILFLVHDMGLSDDVRWRVALKSICVLLDDWRVSLPDRVRLFKNLCDSFRSEFGVSSSREFHDSISRKYRGEVSELETILSHSFDTQGSTLGLLFNLLTERSIISREVVENVLARFRHTNNGLAKELFDYLSSLIHMHINRLFESDNRRHELILYDFLFRFYRSAVAKEQKLKRQTDDWG